jgi:hypothetical protein
VKNGARTGERGREEYRDLEGQEVSTDVATWLQILWMVNCKFLANFVRNCFVSSRVKILTLRDVVCIIY